MPQAHKSTSRPGDIAPSVNPNSAEGLLENIRLGQRIRKLRLKRSMGLVDLGKLTGLSASFLSQLETGRVVPTLRNLARLAIVFDKDLSYFFQSTDEGVFRVQRARDRVRLKMGSPEVDYISESFGILIPEGGMRPCMAEFMPGEDHTFHPEPYAGVEMIYVTEGSLQMEHHGDLHMLQPRDVAYVGGEAQRSYRNTTGVPAKALIISFDGESKGTPRRRRPAAA